MDLCPNDKKLTIYDRGYASFDFIVELESQELFYLMCVKTKFNVAIDAQTKSDGYVWLEKDDKRLHVRVIKFELDSGEIETLVTNITDKHLSKKAFKKLYFMRWPVETKYGIIKKKLQLENFSAKSIEGIQQGWFICYKVVTLVWGSAPRSYPSALNTLTRLHTTAEASCHSLVGGFCT